MNKRFEKYKDNKDREDESPVKSGALNNLAEELQEVYIQISQLRDEVLKINVRILGESPEDDEDSYEADTVGYGDIGRVGQIVSAIRSEIEGVNSQLNRLRQL